MPSRLQRGRELQLRRKHRSDAPGAFLLLTTRHVSQGRVRRWRFRTRALPVPSCVDFLNVCLFLTKDFIYLFLEKGDGKEKERKRETVMCQRNDDRWPFTHVLFEDQTYNPGMCPDRVSNQWPFSLLDDTQPTEPHRSGLFLFFFKNNFWALAG